MSQKSSVPQVAKSVSQALIPDTELPSPVQSIAQGLCGQLVLLYWLHYVLLLQALGSGTRLTLWTNIGRRFIAMGAAGWHICFDVLDHLLSGDPIGRIVGGEAMKFGWQRLNAEYARQFGIETPNRPPPTAENS